MRPPVRPLSLGLVAALLVSLAASGTTHAAFQTVQLSATAAPPGVAVSIHVEMNHRGFSAVPISQLVLVPQAAADGAPAAAHCEDIAGSVVLTEMVWEEATIEFSGESYPGFVGEGLFTVPPAPAGDYYLGERSSALNSGCHVFASFEILLASVPDTAMKIGDR